jgi:hypothetical protein
MKRLMSTDVTGEFCTSGKERHWYERSWKMARRKYTPEQIIGILRQVEVAVSNGRSTPQACRKAGPLEPYGFCPT